MHAEPVRRCTGRSAKPWRVPAGSLCSPWQGGEARLSHGLWDGQGGWGRAEARTVLSNRKVASAVIKQR